MKQYFTQKQLEGDMVTEDRLYIIKQTNKLYKHEKIDTANNNHFAYAGSYIQ